MEINLIKRILISATLILLFGAGFPVLQPGQYPGQVFYCSHFFSTRNPFELFLNIILNMINHSCQNHAVTNHL